VREDITEAVGRFLRDASRPESMELSARGSIIKEELSNLVREADENGARLIVLKVISPQESEVIYDGPGERVSINTGKVQKNGQRTISLSKQRKLSFA
jgi:hypothetical protein